jgi:Flp pilus assembly protein TadD
LAALLIGAATPALADTGPGSLADYVNARAAEADGHVTNAAARYADALNSDPGNAVVAIRAYRAALEAGDYDLADRAAATLSQAGVAPADAALLALCNAIHAGDKRAANAAIDRIGAGPLDFMIPVLKAWQAFDGGAGDPIVPLTEATANPLGRRYSAENRALLLIATGKTADGVDAVRALLGPDQGSFDFRIDAAQLLAAKGHKEAAEAMIAGDDPVLAAMRRDLGDGVKPGFAFGVSRLFTRLAADLAHGDPTPLSIVLTRGALRVDPQDDRARLLLAQTLAGEGATDLALKTLDAVDPSGAYASVAQSARVSVLGDAGDDVQALAVAKAINDGPDATADDARQYGDALIGANRFADAATAYGQAIARAGAAADWSMYLQEGGAFDQAGDWPRARDALKKALSLAPDEPLALNYLGYADIEHGEDAAAAETLLAKASMLKPGDPAITDSLGWAYFQQGEVAKALPLFERASQGQPADVAINEHLGDAYWRTGRFYEARYAWRAASVNADPGDRTRLASKIADGLPPGTVKN